MIREMRGSSANDSASSIYHPQESVVDAVATSPQQTNIGFDKSSVKSHSNNTKRPVVFPRNIYLKPKLTSPTPTPPSGKRKQKSTEKCEEMFMQQQLNKHELRVKKLKLEMEYAKEEHLAKMRKYTDDLTKPLSDYCDHCEKLNMICERNILRLFVIF